MSICQYKHKKWRHPSLSLCLSYCSLFGVCFCALRFGHDLFGRSYSPHAFLTCKVSRTKWCVYGALLPKLSAMFSSHGCQQCVTGKVWYCTHSPRGLCNDTVFHDVHLGMVWFNLWNSMHITWGQSSGTHTHYFIHIVYIYIYIRIYIYMISRIECTMHEVSSDICPLPPDNQVVWWYALLSLLQTLLMDV